MQAQLIETKDQCMEKPPIQKGIYCSDLEKCIISSSFQVAAQKELECFWPDPMFIATLSVKRIVVGHQNIDCRMKWGRGFSISDWLIQDDHESASGAKEVEDYIYDEVQKITSDEVFRTETIYAWMRYNGMLATPAYVKNIPFKLQFKIPQTGSMTKCHSVEVSMFPYLIPKQCEPVMWFKGGIKIDYYFQVMKWTPLEQ